MKPEEEPHLSETLIAPPRKSTWHTLRNYFLTGLVVAAPVGITVYLTWSFIQYVDETIKPLIPSLYNPDTYLPFSVPGIGLLFSIGFLIVLGWLTARTFGKTILSWGESLVDRMPVVRSIYNALKQILETIVSQQGSSFQQVALIEYPRKGIWAMCFITSDTREELLYAIPDEDELVNVFLPTTPNPTSGFLLFVPKRDVFVLEMSTEEAAKVVISGGMVTPPHQKKPSLAQVPVPEKASARS